MPVLWREWCRLCATENGAQVDVFCKTDKTIDTSKAIQKFFSITINPWDDGPKMICTKCSKFVTNLIRFAEHCTQVQEMFSNLLSVKSNNNSIDIESIKRQCGISDVQQEIEEKCDKAIDTTDLMVEYLQITEGEQEQLLTILVAKNEPEDEADNTSQKSERYSSDLHENSVEMHEEYIDKLDTDPMANIETVDSDEDDPTYIAEDYVVDDEDDEEQVDEEDDEVLEVVKSRLLEKPSRNTRTSKKIVAMQELKDEIYKCEVCEKIFYRKELFRRHVRRHNPETDEQKMKFSCSKCSKKFLTEKRLHQHELVHLPPEMKLLHPCLYCDKKFTKSANVQAHIRAIHVGERPFVCEECGKSFTTRGALKEHKYTHIEETPFECSQCPKKFKNMARLKTHEDTHNNTIYVCPNCGLQLNTKRTLQMHMVVHSDQKKYKCHFCGNEYKRSKALKNHLILHTGLRPYMCPFCDKTFANGSNCRSHKKKSHPLELAAMEAAGEAHPATNIPKLEQLKAQPVLTSPQSLPNPILSQSEQTTDNVSGDISVSAYNVYDEQASSASYQHQHAIMTMQTTENEKDKTEAITHPQQEFQSHSLLGAL